jgi:hypothetical protein
VKEKNSRQVKETNITYSAADTLLIVADSSLDLINVT